MIDYFSILLVGLGVGIISSLFGVGGGILVLPALYLLYPTLPPQAAIGTSLLMISFNSLINFYNFHRSGIKISVKQVSLLAVFATVGVTLSSHLSYLVSSRNLKLFFAYFLIFNALQLLWKNYHQKKNLEATITGKPIGWFGLAGFLGGILAGLTGLGGGAIMVPILLNSLRVHPHQVSAYSNFTMIFTGLFGALFFALNPMPVEIKQEIANSLGLLAKYNWGTINLIIVLILTTGSSVTSKLGVKLSTKLSSPRLNLLFAALLIFTAVRLQIQQLAP